MTTSLSFAPPCSNGFSRFNTVSLYTLRNCFRDILKIFLRITYGDEVNIESCRMTAEMEYHTVDLPEKYHNPVGDRNKSYVKHGQRTGLLFFGSGRPVNFFFSFYPLLVACGKGTQSRLAKPS